MADEVFYAHIKEDGSGQLVQDHCRNTAQYASKAVAHIGLLHTAYLAGLLHDAGKFKTQFNEYLMDAVLRHKPVRRGSVNHTFAGVQFVLENWHDTGELGYNEITAEFLAFAIGAHHGLFDCIGEDRESGFHYRQTKTGIGYEESMGNFFRQCADQSELNHLFELSVEEITPILEKISELPQQQDDGLANSEIYFYTGLLERMLLSAVEEGDRRDTAEFMDNAVFPQWPADMRGIWSDCLDRMQRKLREFPSIKPIDRARQTISDRCAVFAQKPGGVYRLNVPTGGGKTLASLRYALTHAKQWNKMRIVFTSPLLSILDQNAQVIRNFVADDSLILEHHSNLVKPAERTEELDKLELLTENWNSPIIITTLVQLLNTIFSGKTGAIRRFHALCNSVIVIDEVQTVPNKMLTLFNLAVNFLTEICGATVVLCSATQPSLEAVQHPLLRKPLDIVPWQQEMWRVFKRTEIQDAGCCRLEELPGLIKESLSVSSSLLVVCNKKDQAAFLFRAFSDQDILCFHLSASMCAAHRRDTLKALQAALEKSKESGLKVLCISTQVVEAGVDISFQRVIRLAAGMDSVIQSAGRCNRNAESDTPSPVSVIQCTGEKLTFLDEIQRGQKATIALLDAYRKAPERFGNDLAGEEAIAFYYRQLYRSMEPGFQDDVVAEHGTVFDLLADNQKYADGNCAEAESYFLKQAFKLAGMLFQVFDQDTVDVLVPYGDGRAIREALISADQPYGCRDYSRIAALLEQAKPYMVSIYQRQFAQLKQCGALMELFEGSAYALADGFYDRHMGFSFEQTTAFWEV